MGQAVILYNSETGRTGSYARAIGDHIAERGIGVFVSPIQDCSQESLEDADYILLGAWTKGLMVVLQGPDSVWKDFAARLPALPEAKLALFTTYKILTGSMFRNMEKELTGRFAAPTLELKSRNGKLSDEDKEALDRFITRGHHG